jgi:hypothetical protein
MSARTPGRGYRSAVSTAIATHGRRVDVRKARRAQPVRLGGRGDVEPVVGEEAVQVAFAVRARQGHAVLLMEVMDGGDDHLAAAHELLGLCLIEVALVRDRPGQRVEAVHPPVPRDARQQPADNVRDRALHPQRIAASGLLDPETCPSGPSTRCSMATAATYLPWAAPALGASAAWTTRAPRFRDFSRGSAPCALR